MNTNLTKFVKYISEIKTGNIAYVNEFAKNVNGEITFIDVKSCDEVYAVVKYVVKIEERHF